MSLLHKCACVAVGMCMCVGGGGDIDLCMCACVWGEGVDVCSVFATLSVVPSLLTTDPITNPTPPIITVPPTNTEIIVGQTVTLDCAATGHPTPSIFWERVFSQMFPRSDHVLPSGAVSIGPVTMTDAGQYRCIAENSEGMMVADAIVTVKGTYERSC